MRMNGQWVGAYTGSNGDGNVIINIDELESNYQGVACLTNDSLPGSMAFFRTADKNARAPFRTDLIQAIDPLTGNVVPWENIKEKYPKEVVFSQSADVTAVLEHESLALSWATDIGVTGNTDVC